MEKTKNKINKKSLIDNVVKSLFLFITLISSLIIVFIVLFIIVKGIKPFTITYEEGGVSYTVDFISFIFGMRWTSPIEFGIGFIIINTIYVVFLSLLLAVPISILTALFIVRMAPKWLSIVLKSVIELLSAIPSIIYGLFGLGVITLIVKNISGFFGYQSAGGLSALTVILVLSIMIIPTITMISITAISQVKENIINGSLALGVSKTQTDFNVVLRSAKSGIFSGIILGVGRALGEATAVSLVAGNNTSWSQLNLFDTTRTLTSTMLMGLKETSGIDYDIRFSIGIVLIILIIVVNLLLNVVKRRIAQ